MRILTFSSLYPSETRPHFGVFVETRLRHVLATGRVEATVMAPVPWFPLASPAFGQYGVLARTPAEEHRHGIRVLHPRYPALPKIGEVPAPWLMAAALASRVRRLQREGFDFDLIDAHYFYPDGVAAAVLARLVGKPVVITARGSDLNLFGTHRIARRAMCWAAHRAATVVTVSDALRTTAVSMGMPAGKLVVLRNGVDSALFRPGERAAQRAALGLTGPTLVSVGHLVPAKGHELVVRALVDLPEASLLIVGEGPERERLRAAADDAGVGPRVRFLGAMPQEHLADVYGAADVLLLASSREGWPNVLLESMACGTPVVAADVGGCAEVVAVPEAGRLLAERTPACIARTVRALLAAAPDRAATRRYAEGCGWGPTTAGQLAVFEAAITPACSAGRDPLQPAR